VRGGRLHRLLILGLALASPIGCAYGLVAGGEIRPVAFEAVLDRTMQARQLFVSEPPLARVATPDDLIVVVEEALAEQWPEESVRAYEAGLVTMGLWPRGRDLRDETVAVFSSEVAGLYVPATETIYVVEGTRSPLSLRLLSFVSRRDFLTEFVLSHEIVHLLQHVAYPELIDPAFQRIDQDDLDRAIQAALEGDALRYGYEAMGAGIDSLPTDAFTESFEEDVAENAGEALEDAPALLRLTLAFPYAAGLPLSVAEGRGLLDRPPASTEQAMHPERRREPFLVFALRPLRARLPEGCTFLHENTVGELHLSVLFRDLAQCGARLEFVWLTAWDREGDAEEFAEAYAGIAPAVADRAGHDAPPELTRSGREVSVATPALRDLARELGAGAARKRVVDVAELKAHFDPAADASP
jgi:hypothetical protein